MRVVVLFLAALAAEPTLASISQASQLREAMQDVNAETSLTQLDKRVTVPAETNPVRLLLSAISPPSTASQPQAVGMGCAANQFLSPAGVCTECAANWMPTVDQTACARCPNNMVRPPGHQACQPAARIGMVQDDPAPDTPSDAGIPDFMFGLYFGFYLIIGCLRIVASSGLTDRRTAQLVTSNTDCFCVDLESGVKSFFVKAKDPKFMADEACLDNFELRPVWIHWKLCGKFQPNEKNLNFVEKKYKELHGAKWIMKAVAHITTIVLATIGGILFSVYSTQIGGVVLLSIAAGIFVILDLLQISEAMQDISAHPEQYQDNAKVTTALLGLFDLGLVVGMLVRVIVSVRPSPNRNADMFLMAIFMLGFQMNIGMLSAKASKKTSTFAQNVFITIIAVILSQALIIPLCVVMRGMNGPVDDGEIKNLHFVTVYFGMYMAGAEIALAVVEHMNDGAADKHAERAKVRAILQTMKAELIDYEPDMFGAGSEAVKCDANNAAELVGAHRKAISRALTELGKEGVESFFSYFPKTLTKEDKRVPKRAETITEQEKTLLYIPTRLEMDLILGSSLEKGKEKLHCYSGMAGFKLKDEGHKKVCEEHNKVDAGHKDDEAGKKGKKDVPGHTDSEDQKKAEEGPDCDNPVIKLFYKDKCKEVTATQDKWQLRACYALTVHAMEKMQHILSMASKMPAGHVLGYKFLFMALIADGFFEANFDALEMAHSINPDNSNHDSAYKGNVVGFFVIAMIFAIAVVAILAKAKEKE